MNLPAMTATLALSAALGLSAHPNGLAAETKAEPAKQAQPATAPVAAPAPTPKTYTVVSGDNLSAIAEAEQLSSWRALWNANQSLTDPNLINVGQVLTIPTTDVPDRPLPATTNTAALDSAPVYTAPAATATVTTTAAVSSSTSDILARVRQRESGGNYATNTGNGYYGAYQFSLGTWRGVGGTGLPSDASPAEQDMRAQMLYSQRGCSPWPNTCY